MLTEPELNVLRAQGVLFAQEVAFRDADGNLIAENVLTRVQRAISMSGLAETKKTGRLLLDQVVKTGQILN